MMESTLNLVASGNLLSPAQRYCFQSDLHSRAAEGRLGERVFPGLQYFDEIEAYGQEIVSQMFGGCAVDLRPISGSQANLAVLSALMKPEDVLLAVSIQQGGHVSVSGKVHASLLGITRECIPWDDVACDIAYSKLEEVAYSCRPSVIAIGGSVMLYPPQIQSVVRVARAIGARTLYDVSHTAAFVLTGLHDNPIAAGVDVVTFTTCKTIPGPSHAVIASRPELIGPIGRRIFPGLLSGGHLHELAAAVVALCELQEFGSAYAKATLQNAQNLGNCLVSAGLPIVRDVCRTVTETHQVLLDCRTLGGGARVERALEQGGILANQNVLWWDTSYRESSGVRLGTQEITRLGMGPDEIRMIAKWIVQLLVEGRPPLDVAEEIRLLRQAFLKPAYCFRYPVCESDAVTCSG